MKGARGPDITRLWQHGILRHDRSAAPPSTTANNLGDTCSRRVLRCRNRTSLTPLRTYRSPIIRAFWSAVTSPVSYPKRAPGAKIFSQRSRRLDRRTRWWSSPFSQARNPSSVASLVPPLAPRYACSWSAAFHLSACLQLCLRGCRMVFLRPNSVDKVQTGLGNATPKAHSRQRVRADMEGLTHHSIVNGTYGHV